jgi:hypothetical protein
MMRGTSMDTHVARLVVGFLMFFLLGSCSAGSIYPTSVGNLPARDEQYLQLARKCYPEVSSATRLSQGAIFISDRVETPEGRMLLMEAAGIRVNCKERRDGSVQVSRSPGEQSDPAVPANQNLPESTNNALH